MAEDLSMFDAPLAQPQTEDLSMFGGTPESNFLRSQLNTEELPSPTWTPNYKGVQQPDLNLPINPATQPKEDLSMFTSLPSDPPPDNLDVFQQQPGSTADSEKSSTLQNILGAGAGIADMATMAGAKIVYPITHAGTVLGGLNAIKEAITGNKPSAAADVQKFEDWNWTGVLDKAIGQDKYLTENAGWKKVMAPLDWLQEKATAAGGSTVDIVNKALNAVPGIEGIQTLLNLPDTKTTAALAGTAVDMVGQLIPFVLGHEIKNVVMPTKVDPAVAKAQTDALIEHLTTSMEDVSPDRPRYQMPEGEDPKAWLGYMIQTGTNLQDVLEHMSDHKEVHDSPTSQGLAQAFGQRGWDLGLDKTKFIVDPSLDGPAEYRPETDTIVVKNAGVSPDTVIHEAKHALTAGAGDLWQEVSSTLDSNGNRSPLTRDTLTPEQLDIYNRVGAIDQLRQIALDHLSKNDDILKTNSSLGTIRELVNNNIIPKAYYGLADVHEFMSELDANQKFRDLISDVPIPKTGLPTLGPKQTGWRSLYDVAKQAIKNLIMPNATPLLSAALDHTQGLVDHMTPEVRGFKFQDSVYKSLDDNSPLNGRTLPALANLKQVMERHNVDAARAKLVERDGQFLMYKLSDLLRNAASPGEFYTRARALWGAPEFQKFIDENGDRMLRSPVTFIKAFHIDNSFDKLSPNDQILTANHLSVDDFMRKHKEVAAAYYKSQGLEKEFNPNDPDVKLMTQNDLFPDGMFFLPSTQFKMVKATAREKLAGLLAKYFVEKGEEYTTLGSQVNYRGLDMMRDYISSSPAEKKNIYKARFRYDNIAGRDTLKAMGLMWPTKEMLMAPDIGLTEKEATAYQGITKMVDFAYELTNEALAKDGKPPIEQIPGFFPHFFEGSHRVLIERTILDPTDLNGKGRTFTFRVKPFATRQGAEQFIQKLQSGQFDPPGEQWRPRLNPDSGKYFFVQETKYKQMSLTDNLSEAMNSYHSMDSLGPEARAAIEKIEAESMKGSIKHILERSDIEGYRGDLVNDMGFNEGIMARLGVDSYNNRILKTDEVYMKNVSEFYKNSMFMNEVATKIFDHAPIDSDNAYYGTYIEKMEQLKRYIKEYTSNFTGENFNHLAPFIEQNFKPELKMAGLDPELASKGMHAARNFLSLTKLRGNIGFYIGNFVQPLHSLSNLVWANELRRQNGVKIDYLAPYKAFVRAMTNRNDPALQASLQWAKDNHVIDDAMLEWQLRAKAPSTVMNWVHTITGGKINPHIEEMARSFSFAIAHEFYRDVYPGDSAKIRSAAKASMEMVNVNYDRSSRPLMYQNFGIAGEAMSPFAVYRNAYIGNGWLMFKAIKSGKFAPQAFLPLLQFQLIYLATAGASGLMMYDEWDQAVKIWNWFNPGRPLPDAQQASLWLQHKVGMSDAFTFGALSQATKIIPGLEHGVNLGSSMSASGLDASLGSALNPFLAAIGETLALGAKATAHLAAPESFPGVSFADVWPAAEQLTPQPLRGPLELFGQPNPSVAMKTTKYEGYVERQEPDFNSMFLLGRLSVTEAKARAQEKAVSQYAEFEKEHLKQLVSNAAMYAQTGGKSQQTYDEAQAMALNDLDVSSEDFAKMVADEMDKRTTTVRQREDRIESVAAAHARRTRERFGGYDDNR